LTAEYVQATQFRNELLGWERAYSQTRSHPARGCPIALAGCSRFTAFRKRRGRHAQIIPSRGLHSRIFPVTQPGNYFAEGLTDAVEKGSAQIGVCKVDFPLSGEISLQKDYQNKS